MADISFLRNEDMEDTDQPMEGADQETSGEGPADGRGDEGGGESLPPMTKLQQHASCNVSFNRQLVGRILVEVFRGAVESGTELNVDEVMQPVLKLVNDTDPAVRLDLVEQLPHVAMICQEAPDRLGDVLPRHLIQIIGTFLRDGDQQVRQSTHAALLALIDRGLLDKDSAEYVVAPTLLRMSQQTERLELFTLAIDGMGKVARILGEKTAERLFLNRYLALCKHANFFVRKLCAIRLGEFSAAMRKKTVYEKLLPMYITLCEDAVWTVRKSCVDVIVSFACCVSLQHRRETLSELLANFLTDDSKWVKVSAFQILGPFISTFAKQFTGFSYNQYGELVLTDQHGTELRYNVLSFAGSAEPPLCKAVITGGQIVNFYDEDVSVNPTIRLDTLTQGTDTNKENVPLNDRTKTQWNITNPLNDDNSENDATIIHDYDEFNPFRYYYIPPNLPLDSELVDAAIVESTSKSPSEESQSESYPIEPYKTSVENEEQQNEEERGGENNAEEADEQSIHWVANNVDIDPQFFSHPELDEMGDERAGLPDETERIEQQMDDIKRRVREDARKQRSVKYSSSKATTNEETSNNSAIDTSSSNNSAIDTSSSKRRIYFPKLFKVDIASTSIDHSNHGTGASASNKTADASADTGQTIVPHVLVNHFVSMADPCAMSIGIEIPRHCAFSFPAVALTLGRENWPLLKKAYEELAEAREYRVRRTMASSIHELAMILGEDLAARDLLPIYDGFIKDLDEVRIGALKHLTTFFKVLRPADRRLFLPRLKAFLTIDNEGNWRFREEVASRLLEAIPLFSPVDVADHIGPLAFPLLIDKVAAVRHTALALVTQIISYLSANERLVTSIIADLTYLLTPEPSKWTSRQTFALLCSSLISNEAVSAERFGTYLLPCLLSLSSDIVPNVRLAVVTALSRHVIHILDYLGVDQAEEVNQKLIQMRTDPDRDVRIVAGGVAGKYYPQGSEWKVPAVEPKFSY